METCNVIKPTRHGKELLGKGIQSATEKGDSVNDSLTYLSGNDTKLGTDHTKADVYESSNDMSVGNSISENQIQSDSHLEDDLFSYLKIMKSVQTVMIELIFWQMKVLQRHLLIALINAN